MYVYHTCMCVFVCVCVCVYIYIYINQCNKIVEETWKNVVKKQLHSVFLHLFSSVQSLSHVRLFRTPWTAALQASLSITNYQSLVKLMSIKSVVPPNHLMLCHPLLLPSVFPRNRVFYNQSVLCIRWPKYWCFSISPSNEYSGLIF